MVLLRCALAHASNEPATVLAASPAVRAGFEHPAHPTRLAPSKASTPALTSEVFTPDVRALRSVPEGTCVGRCLQSTSAITTVLKQRLWIDEFPERLAWGCPLLGAIWAAEHARCTAGREVTVQGPIEASTV
jgi:hypothetical protein